MASSNLTNVSDNIFMLGVYHQTLAAEPYVPRNLVGAQELLRPEEALLIRGIATCDDSSAAAACQKTLDLGLEFFYTVKHQIASLQDAWDHILDEKRRYDAVGWSVRSRSFMDCFRVCSYLIPQRVSIGFPGPYGGAQGVDTSLDASDLSVNSQLAADYTETPSVFGGSEETLIQEGSLEEPFLSDEDGYPEELALSPTSQDTFEQADVRDGRAEIISISSDDSDDSKKSEELQFPLELEDVVYFAEQRNFSASDPHKSQAQLAESSQISLPRAQQLHQERANRDESFVYNSRAPQPQGKPLSPHSKTEVPKKRKRSRTHESSGSEFEEGAPWKISGKRPRAI